MNADKKLLREVSAFYKKRGRTYLPWRATRDPYNILVSEMMLQQTQVNRVIPYYERFIKKFPDLATLADAPLRDVLVEWSGLGYNRRARFLHESARILVQKKKIPREVGEWEALPGVGPYTARAIVTFAFNRPEVFVETNIRSVFIHFYFQHRKKVSDREILPLVAVALSESKLSPSEFYAALMDYGAQLKQQGIRLNSKSAHYTTQATFAGSARQLRGTIVRELLKGSRTLSQLAGATGRPQKVIEGVLVGLKKEGLVVRIRSRFRVA
jgi:A/G-specific adenine glycosylase